MLRYFVKRILLAIVTVFIIITITFFAMNAIPGGPFASEKLAMYPYIPRASIDSAGSRITA